MARKREHSVNIWFSSKELIKLKDKMALVSCNPGYNRSDYIRNCALGKDIIVAPGIREIQNNIREISTNLGQLTNKVNSGYVAYLGNDLKEMKEDLNKLCGKLAKVLKKI